MQTKLESFIESWVNIFIGYTINIGSQYLIFPLFGIDIAFHEHLQIGLYFTVVSLLRSYGIRRYYNYKTLKRLQHGN